MPNSRTLEIDLSKFEREDSDKIKNLSKIYFYQHLYNMTKLTPPQITPFWLNENRKLCDIVSQNKKLGELTLNTSRYEDISERYITKVKDKNNKVLGYEIFSFDDFNNNLFGYSIRVNPDLRQKNLKLGELLRLSSIIELFENKMQKLKIYSKDTAIYFHAKYKFQPDIDSFKDRDEALKSILENPKKGFETLIQSAQVLLEKIKQHKEPEFQRNAIKEANQITNNYIKKILNSKEGYKDYPFNYGMGMELTKENIIENKDFYNKLFIQHGIDYKI